MFFGYRDITETTNIGCPVIKNNIYLSQFHEEIQLFKKLSTASKQFGKLREVHSSIFCNPFLKLSGKKSIRSNKKYGEMIFNRDHVIVV